MNGFYIPVSKKQIVAYNLYNSLFFMFMYFDNLIDNNIVKYREYYMDNLHVEITKDKRITIRCG